MCVCLIFRRVRASGPAKQSFVEIGDEIISTAILSLLLIQVGQLSVTGDGTGLKRLGLSLSRKGVVRLTVCLDMITAVDWDVEPQKQTKHR